MNPDFLALARALLDAEPGDAYGYAFIAFRDAVLFYPREAAALMLPRIHCVRRSDDYMAHVAGDTREWEAGATMDEAIGRLARRLGIAKEIPRG